MKNILILLFLFLTFGCSEEYMGEGKEYMSEGKDVQLSANLNVYKDCETNGGMAGDEGLKTWCWTGDLANEINNTPGTQDSFSSGQLAKSVHYDGGSVFAQDGRLHFSVNPTNPAPPIDSPHPYNYRSEIRDKPSNVNHPVGTEQWWGFDYKFGEDYIADELPWILWQTHGDFQSPPNPMTSLWINSYGGSSSQGELVVVNAAISTNNAKVTPTGIVPIAGQTLNIVVHMVWGDENEGLYEVWVDDVEVYSEKERTVYVEQPRGGYWKIGIYKWPWQESANVDSADLLNTSIGNLRVIKNSPGECGVLNAYNMVTPTVPSCPDDMSNENSSIAIASQGPGSWDGCKLITGVLDDTTGCVLKLQKNEVGDQWAGYRMIIDLEDQANNIDDGDRIAISLDGNGVDGKAKFKVYADNNAQPLISHEYGEGQGWSTHSQEVTVPNGATELFLWLYPNMGSTDPGHSLFGNLVVQEVGCGYIDVSDDNCPDDLSNANSSIAIASQGPGSWDGCKLITGVLDDANNCVLKLQKNEIGDQWAGYRLIIDIEDPANNINDGDNIAISLDGNGVDGKAKFKVYADNTAQPLISHEYGEGQGWSTHTQEVTIPNGATELFLWLYPNMGSTDPGHSLFGNLVVQEVGCGYIDVSDDNCPDDLSNTNSSIAIASQGPGSWDGCKLIAGVLDDTTGCVLKLQKNEIGDQWAGYRMIIDIEDQANNITAGDRIAISLDGNGVDGNAKFKVYADNNAQPLISHEYGEGQGWSTHTQEVTVPNGATELFLWLYPNMGSTDPGHSLFGNLVVQEVN